ncbi:TIGR04283 family arsenosugar biosynthesis glycosyltransferase [Hahella sp. CCB-MM4]|uniref:TIGR04283 family arsenosugar biosynthesis glycosyltransferase n=1 Tax=Hahella sp. (strain CCB-MM4) TaxID=1926491 RepID=UPI001FF06245|nr:TIGR04283 family arsenosugar biosynthesis glycosyltransferase [Hahella sp. CCB-MM4]
MTEPNISIVIPVLNEEASIASFLRLLQPSRANGAEVILVDGGSTDGTRKAAEAFCDKVIDSEKGRARQMNAGAAVARGNLLLFLHADTQLPESFLDLLSKFQQSPKQWGRFNVSLSGSKLMFSVISFMINWRSRISGIATGDQAIFVKRSAFDQVGGFSDIPLMEDVDLCKKLLKFSRPFCISEPVITSSRRWEVHGTWRTIFLMWKLRWKFALGVPPEVLVKEYYG